MKMIPLFKPTVGHEEIEAVTRVLESGWWGLGPETEAFEQEFAEYMGVRYAVATNSCTTALELALKCINITFGDGIITTPITFVSTAHAIMHRRARALFADVDFDNLLISPRNVEKLATTRTRAIIPVHLYGVPCDMERLREIADNHRLKIIEDCAHACGSTYKGKPCGSLGDIGCFSFHAVKNLATGDGGMLVTNDEDIATKARKFRWLGISKSTHERVKNDKRYGWEYYVEDLGFKAHMNDISAAIGRVQLKNLKKNNARRKEIAKRYIEGLTGCPVKLPNWTEESSWHIFAIRTPIRNELNVHLKEKGISTGVHYMPIHLHPFYKEKLPNLYLFNAETEWIKLLSLPIYPDLSEHEQQYIIDSIRSFMCL